jgi:hypothetical protein
MLIVVSYWNKKTSMEKNHSLSYQKGLSLFNKLHGGQAGEQFS